MEQNSIKADMRKKGKEKGSMKIFASIIGVIAAAFLVFTLSIDGIVKCNIEESASELLNTKVEISDVDISMFNGKGEIEGFVIYNPEGFSDEVAIGFEQMNMEVELKSLFSDTVLVEELIVKNPEIYLEQKGSNANLKQLNDNIQASSADEESSKSLVIDYFLMEEGRAEVSSEISEIDGTEVSVSSLELTGVGRSNSNTLEETLKQILEPVIQEVVSETVKNQFMDKVEDAVNDLIGSD